MFLYKIDDQLSLKLAEVSDADRLFDLTEKARDYLKEWLPWLDLTTSVEDTREFLSGTMKGYAENKSMTTVVLYEREIVGTAGFNSINWSNKTAYIGYWLGHEYQGRGIMTKVAGALTDYAFNHLKLNKVEIRAAEENKKSRGIPERLRFVKEGKIRQAEWLYDHYVDHVVYGILAEEWADN